MFGPSGVLPTVLTFTQFYPGFTQLPRVKLGKTVLRFYPPTLLILTIFHWYRKKLMTQCNVVCAHTALINTACIQCTLTWER